MAKKKNKQKIKQTGNPLQEALARFKPLIDEASFESLLSELDKTLYPSLRINPLKVEDKEIIKIWAVRYLWEYQEVPYCDSGFWITDSEQPISKTVEHSMGHYYIQDAASMLPVELFDFSDIEDPIILDMAASPGGKTTHLVSKTADQGLVIANDSSRDRLTALRIVLQNWGATHTAISNYPGEHFGNWFPGTFDRILLDAPCSMQGLRETDAHPLRSITQKEIDTLAKRQIKLLESALLALKTGGQVVYSTCTLTPEEDEHVLDAVLQKYPHAIQIDPLDSLMPYPAPGLSSYGQNKFHIQVENAARLWPHSYGTAGFFAARITKVEGIEGKQKTPPARTLDQANWFPLSKMETRRLFEWFLKTFAINLETIVDQNHLVIWRFGDSLHLFPGKFFNHFADFPVQGLGLQLGKEKADGVMLSHEFCTRFGHLAKTNLVLLDEDQLHAWMAGEDLFGSWQVESKSGQVIVKDCFDRIVGCGKVSGNRLRNDLPKRVLLH